MKTIFAHFQEYDAAAQAYDSLQAETGEDSRLNVIVLESVAKNALQDDGLKLEKAKTGKTDEVGGVEVHGLNRLLAGNQPVQIGGLGNVYAAGQIATVLTTTASDPDAADGGLESALQDFNLPAGDAQAFFSGVENGGLLLFIRTPDEEAVTVRQILEPHAQRIASV